MNDIDLRFKYIAVVLTLCLTVFFLTIFGEKSDLFNGIGSDGLSISHFVPDLLSHLQKKEYFSEAGTRLLPMIITHVFYRIITFFRPDELSSIMFDDYKVNISKNVVLTLEILNSIYLCLSLIIFSYILYIKKISFRAFMLCAALFYLNFMFLKQFFFEPVFFDPFYLLYSIMLLFSILFRIKWLQYLLLFFSVFVSSLAVVFSTVLLFSSNSSNFKIKFSRRFVLLSFIISYLFISFYLLRNPLCTETLENKTIYSLSYISIISTISYIWIFFFIIIPEKFNVRFTKNAFVYVLFISSIIFFKLILSKFSFKVGLEICDGLNEGAINKIINNMRQVNTRPFGFLSSHFNYFGLIIIFILFLGNSIKLFLESNQKYIPLVILFIFCSLTSESRYLTTFLPFIFFMIFEKFDLYINRLTIFLSNQWLFFIILFNLIWSGFYIKINPLDTNTYFKIINSSTDFNIIFSNVFQKYFKHLGPWTSNESYFWQLSVFFITLFLFLVYFGVNSFYTKKKKVNL